MRNNPEADAFFSYVCDPQLLRARTLFPKPKAWMERRAEFSHASQIRLNFMIALLARPEVKRDGGQLIDEGDKSRVFCQVNGFEVALASVTAFDSHAWDLFRGVVGEFVRINLEAGWAC